MLTLNVKNQEPIKFDGLLEELSYPKKSAICDPILVTLLKMRLHYSQFSRENTTPSSGTAPLASYKEVPLPRLRGFDV